MCFREWADEGKWSASHNVEWRTLRRHQKPSLCYPHPHSQGYPQGQAQSPIIDGRQQGASWLPPPDDCEATVPNAADWRFQPKRFVPLQHSHHLFICTNNFCPGILWHAHKMAKSRYEPSTGHHFYSMRESMIGMNATRGCLKVIFCFEFISPLHIWLSAQLYLFYRSTITSSQAHRWL